MSTLARIRSAHRIHIIGSPGAGKSTLAQRLSTELGLPVIHLDLIALGLDDVPAIEAHDLLTGATYIWRGWHHYVRLDPWEMPAHVFALRPAG